MPASDSIRKRKAKEAKLRKHRDLLLESLRCHVLPLFIQDGFVITDRTARVSRISQDVFPLGLLRRSRPDGGMDLAEIQFMTHHRAAFRINACAVPKNGMMTLGGQRVADELEAGGLHDHFEMYASPRWRRWFSVLFWRLRKPEVSDYESLARDVVELLPEINLALREGKLGPHMRKISYPIR